MDKIILNTSNDDGQIDLEYDSEKYSIECIEKEEKRVFIIKRLIDERVVKTFDDNIGFIVQSDEDKNSHFFVSCCSEDDNEQYKLRQYVDYYHLCDELVLNAEVNISAFYLSDFYTVYNGPFMSVVQESANNSTRYGCFRFGTSTSMMPALTFALDDLANNLDQLNSKNLKFLASELYIEGRSKMSIDELKEQIKELLLTTKTIGSIDINNCLSESSEESSRLWTVAEFVEKFQEKSSNKVKKLV